MAVPNDVGPPDTTLEATDTITDHRQETGTSDPNFIDRAARCADFIDFIDACINDDDCPELKGTLPTSVDHLGINYPADLVDPFDNIDKLLTESQTADVWMSVHLWGSDRCTVIRANWSGEAADADEVLEKVRALNGFAVGWPGHIQVFLPLAEDVDPIEAKELSAALHAHLSPGCDPDTVGHFLRPPGSYVHTTGTAPAPVEFLIRPDFLWETGGAHHWDPWLLAFALKGQKMSDTAFAFPFAVSPLEGAIQHKLTMLRVNAEAKRRLDEEQRPPIVLPPITTLDVRLAAPRPVTRYRIDEVAPDRSRIVLSAQYKAGKTILTANLIRALVDNEPFLGTFNVNTPARRVVLIDDELSENMLLNWLEDQGIVNTAAVWPVSLRGNVGTFNILDETCGALWVQRLREFETDYLILDCLRPVLDALGLDENREAGRFLVPFDALLAQAGINDSAIVHHMGHTGERSRGDSRIQDWPDAIWRLVRETDEPGSPRYFSAFGRDVNVPEGRLAFDEAPGGSPTPRGHAVTREPRRPWSR